MKKYSCVIVSLLLLMTSCNEWFDVTSSSEIRQKDHFKNVQGFQQSLNGCYIAMTDNSLYGQTLSWHALEVMAHQYESSTNSLLNDLFHHNYKSQEVTTVSDQTWARLYNVIVNANDALENLEKRKENLHPIDYAVLKGEFLAIRAYLHFDLLRLYGYGNWANRAAELDAKLTIPYVTRLNKEITPQSTGADVFKFILKDVDEAAALLFDNDPITKRKKNEDYAKIDADKFYHYRDLHLNYYAVRALQARIYQWIGTPEAMEKALKAASEVIAFVEAGGYKDYTFKTEVNFISSNALSPSNYSLATEAIFALNVNKLEDRISQYLIPDFQSGNVFAFQILPLRVEVIYEKLNLDVRFSKLLHQNLISSSKGYVPMKLYQRELDSSNKNRISLIRIPEVYYIAAEAYLAKGKSGVNEALKLINTVREKRGLFTPLADLSVEKAKDEVRKEYLKEYIGEGVLFFQYKRWGEKRIPNLDANETMGDKQYVIPYPDFEIQSGRRQ